MKVMGDEGNVDDYNSTFPRSRFSGLVPSSQLMASAARRTVPPLRGYDYVVVYRARPLGLGSQLPAHSSSEDAGAPRRATVLTPRFLAVAMKSRKNCASGPHTCFLDSSTACEILSPER